MRSTLVHRAATARAVAIATCIGTSITLATPTLADRVIPSESYTPIAQLPLGVEVSAGGMHEFRRGLDDGGSVSITRGELDTSLRLKLSEKLALSLSVGYEYDLYNFDGAPFPAVGGTLDPWDDIHSVGFGGLLSYRMNDTWTISGGAFGKFSAERDASWSDAFSGGGLVSLTYSMGERGIIGFGVGMTTAIEDDAKFFPVFVIDMPINDQLRVTTLRVPTPVFSNGLELVYEASESCEIALGVANDRQRFRLNDNGPVPDGIGEEQSIPVWLRASWAPSASSRLDLMAGVVAWREFGIANENGLRIDTDRGEPAAFVAAAFRFSF